MATDMKVDQTQIAILVVLFIGFLCSEQISELLGHTLDLLPVRFAAILLVLGSLYLGKYMSLAIFLLILAVYIQHHQSDLARVTVFNKSSKLNPYEIPQATVNLQDGGRSSEDYETIDYTPQKEDQENEFSPVGPSIDEKHVLQTEMLGSKSQALFPDSMRHANALEAGNRNGASD